MIYMFFVGFICGMAFLMGLGAIGGWHADRDLNRLDKDRRAKSVIGRTPL